MDDRLKLLLHRIGALAVGAGSAFLSYVVANTDTIAPLLAATGVAPAYVPIVVAAITTAIGYDAKSPKDQIAAAQTASAAK